MAKQRTYKFEKFTEIPRRGVCGRGVVRPFLRMKPGESVLLEGVSSIRAVAGSLAYAAKKNGVKLSVRREPKGIRVYCSKSD